MITIASTAPGSSLASCISNYTLISFNTNGSDLIYPLLANSQCNLVFFLKDQPVFSKNDVAATYPDNSYKTIFKGLFDHLNKPVKFNGDYLIFIVRFTVTGFYNLFGLTPSGFTNKVVPTGKVLGRSLATLFTQLQKTREISKMSYLSDEFFKTSAYGRTQFSSYDEMTQILDYMLGTKLSLPILTYANNANMSLRNFGRKFIEQVGVSPKIYCCLLRFDAAIRLKIFYPEKSWASVAHECGYYDQMHLIRDFKKFAGTTPARLIERIASLPVEFINAIKKIA